MVVDVIVVLVVIGYGVEAGRVRSGEISGI